MASITLPKVQIYDPAYPFKLIKVDNPGVDTYFRRSLITRELREALPKVPEIGEVDIEVSSGMKIKIPLIEVGFHIGTIKIDSVEVGIGSEGFHDLIIGRDILEQVFDLGSSATEEKKASITSEIKDHPESLAIELYPIIPPIDLKSLEKMLEYQRWLYNIHLVASGEIKIECQFIDKFFSDDFGVPNELRLKLTWLDMGSIWLTLAAGSKMALKYVASLYEAGVTAKMASHIAESEKAKNEAKIQEATREATIENILAEQERLKTENIGATYEAWRNEVRNNLTFMDELIEQVEDEEVRRLLRERKEQAILELADQHVLPIVRNMPRPYSPPEGVLLLPPGNPSS